LLRNGISSEENHGYIVKAMSVIQTSNLQLKYIFARLRKSSFVKNVLIVMSGTAIAQIIGFALIPIISRLYSPSDFGVFGSFNAVLTVIAAGVTLDYTLAIMLPKQKEDAINTFMLSCVITAIVSGCCLAVCLFAPSFFQDLIKAQNNWILVFLILAIFVSGLNRAFQAWCVRVKAFKHTSASQIIRSLSSSGTQVGLGYLHGGPFALVCGVVLGNMLASFNLARVVLRDLMALRRNIRWNRMKQLAIEYRDFPMYSASENVINALSAGLPIILLTHFYGIAVAGAYAFGMRILHAPMRLILMALRQVLFQKASETHNSGGHLLPLYIKITSGLFALAFVPSLILIVWSPQIFSWVFSSQWYTAGEFVQSLVFWMMFVFCNVPAVLFARVVRIQRFVFFYNLLLLAMRVLALVLGGLYLSSLHTIMLFALVGAGMNVFLILRVGYILMKKEGQDNLDLKFPDEMKEHSYVS